MPEQKMYTEEEVQQLVDRQKTVTTWENMMDRLGPQMSQTEFNLCQSFRMALAGVPAPGQQKPAEQPNPDGGGKYPD